MGPPACGTVHVPAGRHGLVTRREQGRHEAQVTVLKAPPGRNAV